MKSCNLFYIASVCLLLLGCEGKNEQTVPVNLRTEYLCNPIGIDTQQPRFTWEYAGEEENFKVSRFEIRVGTAPDKLRPYEEGMVLKPHTRYYWNVTVWDEANNRCRTSETATFETAKFTPADWSGAWITDNQDKEFEPAPMFRKSFTVDKPVKEARLYIAAAGYYELFLNGKRVGDHYLDPGYTHFDKRILYVTHDVTSALQQGENAVAAVLGNGWYNEQSVAVWNFETARWRNRPRMLCDGRVCFANCASPMPMERKRSWQQTKRGALQRGLIPIIIFTVAINTMLDWKKRDGMPPVLMIAVGNRPY